MTESGVQETTKAHYVQPNTVTEPLPKDPVLYILREDEGLVEFEREQEEPVRSLEPRPILEFQAHGFDEIIAFNFNLEKVWPSKLKKNMAPHRTPRTLEGFEPCKQVSEGVFQIPITLTPRVTAYINNCLTDGEYVVIKWDVLARKGDTWYFVDPGVGIKPKP